MRIILNMSMHLTEVAEDSGKAGIWQALFRKVVEKKFSGAGRKRARGVVRLSGRGVFTRRKVPAAADCGETPG
jgi:hypothetical protein